MYREISPPPSLETLFSCFWCHTVGDADEVVRVLPDASSDVILVGEAEPIVVGVATRTALVALPKETTLIGARLRPGTATSLLGVPAHRLTDRDVALSELWGDRDARAVWQTVGDAVSIDDKLVALRRTLTARSACSHPVDEAVVSAVRWLGRNPGAHVSAISEKIGVSSRQLLRRVQAAVGYGPKTLHRVLRFQRLLVAASCAPAQSLASLAFDTGFLDQAHLCREVRELSGTTPTLLLRRSNALPSMSDFFNTVDRDARYALSP